VKYDELKQCPHLGLKHLAVFYDRENDKLVYDRKLKPGAGTRMYGLEVCKSLHLPQAFLERAYAIRNKYYVDTQGELQATVSRYNAKKVKGMCEECGKYPATETHHIHEQHLADERGFIGHFHKNHPANLKALCEECHHKIHGLDK
jgi:DNA mismatch repair protein MutS